MGRTLAVRPVSSIALAARFRAVPRLWTGAGGLWLTGFGILSPTRARKTAEVACLALDGTPRDAAALQERATDVVTCDGAPG